MAHLFKGFRGYCAALGTAHHSPILSGACKPGRAPFVAVSCRSAFSGSPSFSSAFSGNLLTTSPRVCSYRSFVGVPAHCVCTQPSLVPGVPDEFATSLRSSFSTATSAAVEKSPEIFKALKAGESAIAASLPAHLRHPFGGSVAESFTDKVYRWLDVTGVLTRWNNRKEWVLDLIPMNRLGSSTITEFERKQEIFVTLNAQILALIAIYLAYTGIQHVNVKPANPSYEGFPGVDGRKKDFTLTNRLFFMHPKERCKECRWLDLECKKECFTRLKAEGYKLIVNKGDPLSTPRTKLEPPHFH